MCDANPEAKIAAIEACFKSKVGHLLIGYETAQLLNDDGTWDDWKDLPVRLFTKPDSTISILWSKFDDLWIAEDFSLPFRTDGYTVRWSKEAVAAIHPAINQTICTVMLGRGKFSIDGNDMEIWTRLLMKLSEGWLEIFNALDENGYQYHTKKPPGDFVPCI